MQRPVVVFPHPDSPTSPRVSPRRIEKLTPATAWTQPTVFPKSPAPPTGKRFTKSWTSRIDSGGGGRPPPPPPPPGGGRRNTPPSNGRGVAHARTSWPSRSATQHAASWPSLTGRSGGAALVQRATGEGEGGGKTDPPR